LNVEFVYGKTMCDVQCAKFNDHSLPLVNSYSWIRIHFAVLEVCDVCDIETPVKRRHRNSHSPRSLIRKRPYLQH
jgi:hypothetical protein